MAYLDDLAKQTQYQQVTGFDVGLRPGAAYASYYQPSDVIAPHYIYPSAYNLQNIGWRSNEFVYHIIMKRAKAESKARTMVMDNSQKFPLEIKDHALTKLLKSWNEKIFWQIKRITQDIAGFCAWEIEYNNIGEPINLWYMRADWCSFLRGEQKPMRAIRYQPYGLPPMDIPMIDEKTGQRQILFFSTGENFDPIYPQWGFMSPVAHCLGQIQQDNSATFFLKDFWEHGTHTQGILSVQQSIDEKVAEDYQRRWVEAHGGAGNFNRPPVLGLGTTWVPTGMNFRDMVFPELDARTESRICNAFDMDPIVAGAKAGLEVSTYDNQRTAHINWYHDSVTDMYEENAQTLTEQMLPVYHENPEKYICQMDTSKVYALQDNRDDVIKRANTMFTSTLFNRNESRKEANADPIDGEEGEAFYSNSSGMGQNENPNGVKPMKPEIGTSPADEEAKRLERINFRKFAVKRRKENKLGLLTSYEFKILNLEEQKVLLEEFGVLNAQAAYDAIHVAFSGRTVNA